MRKKLIFLALAVVLTALFVPLVQAQTTWVSFTDHLGAAWYPITSTHPSATSAASAIYASIDGNDEYLQSFRFYVRTVGDGYATFRGELLNVTDSNQTVVATSINNPSIASSLGEWVTFYFNATFNVGSGDRWGMAIICEEGLVNTEDYVAVSYVYQSHIPALYANFYHNSDWHNEASSNVEHQIVAITTPDLEEEADDDEESWSTDDSSELIDNAVEFLVPVVVMLLPAVLFVIFFKRTDKWLILIGLTIGVGLGYYFFNIPVWLVFLVAIGLIGLAYSEVRRNG